MNWNFETMYAAFLKNDQSQLLDGKWGVERELHRITYDGNLALTPHPSAFGDKLKNKEITTDFAESQMELVTPPFSSVEQVTHYLKMLHEKVYTEVGSEFLWPLSMPPRLPEEELIPIARFEDTKEGNAAYRYRQGLANRYGKKMQMISGIHFNFSFGKGLLQVLHREFGAGKSISEFTDELYFSVTRNFLRYRWLLIYLFGASPSFDETYDSELKKEVENIRKCCPECCENYMEYATSLRVSRFGYSNHVKIGNNVYYNSKEEYVQNIKTLMSTKSRKYAKLSIQLNDKILQKDSEFYSPIRLKQITDAGESQIDAINKRGVKYAEIRILDINPFEMTGISLRQMQFLQIFILFCLFEDNKLITTNEWKHINNNHNLVAMSGRKPQLMLYRLNRGKISLRDWGESIFHKLQMIAKLLDQNDNEMVYSSIVASEYQKLNDLSLLPSARIQEEMISRRDSFLDFGIKKAREYKTINR